MEYFLIEKEGVFYTFSNGEWAETTLEAPLTKQNFIEQGVQEFTYEMLRLIEGPCSVLRFSYEEGALIIPTPEIDIINFLNGLDSFSILCYTEEEGEVPTLDLTFPPNALHRVLNPAKLLAFSPSENLNLSTNVMKTEPEVIVANGDIDFSTSVKINSFFLTALQKTGVVRIASSFDKGATWFGESLISDISDKTEFLEKGRTISSFNSHNFEDDLGPERLIRHAYLISKDAEIDQLSSDVDLRGALKKIMNSEDIRIEIGGDAISVEYKNAGTYVFNILN